MKRYNFRVTMNGIWEEFNTLEEACEYILKNWTGKEDPNIIGTHFCMIKLHADVNVITDGGFQINRSK